MLEVVLRSIALLVGIVDVALLVLSIIDSLSAVGDTVLPMGLWRGLFTALFVLIIPWAIVAWRRSRRWCNCHAASYTIFVEGVLGTAAVMCLFTWVESRPAVLVLYVVTFIPRAVLTMGVLLVWGTRPCVRVDLTRAHSSGPPPGHRRRRAA